MNSIDPLAVLAENLVTVNTLFVYETYLYSGGSDKVLSQWNLTAFELVKKLEGPQTGIFTAVADRFYAYAGSEEASIYQWNVESGVQTGLLVGHSDDVFRLRFLDNVLFSASSDRTVRAWNTQTLENVQVINANYLIRSLAVKEGSVSICGFEGIAMHSISTGEVIAQARETIACLTIINAPSRIFSGHTDSIIRSRDLDFLSVLETYQGHVDSVLSLVFDESRVLYSCSSDGSVKKWNMASRKVAFSFEDRNSSVTALAQIENLLFVGLKDGRMVSYNVDNAVILQENLHHQKAISTMIASNGSLYSTGSDGTILRIYGSNISAVTVLFNAFGEPLIDLALSDTFIFTVRNEMSVMLIPRNGVSEQIRLVNFQEPLLCVTATESGMIAGSKSGTLFMWDIDTLTLRFEFEGHRSQVNDILVDGNRFFSASNDKRIIEWSLEDQLVLKIYQRSSLAALGHLGPVNSLSFCADTLFSAGSDQTVRRWNTQTGRHEDVYFGFFKSVSVVLCYNETLFAGGEDFGVLMFKPEFIEQQKYTSTSSKVSSNTRSRVMKKLRALDSNSAQVISFEFLMIIISAGVALVVLAGVSLVLNRRLKGKSFKQAITVSASDSTSTITDITTVINSVIGISKHAAYLVENSAFSKTKKIAAGGGGELFLAKVMDPVLKKKTNEIVVQKIVFVKNKLNEEAFFQEVGIMIMLVPFPNFCKIVAYTESPASMILKYYPDGSLHDWIRKSRLKVHIKVKFLREIAGALNVMHSYYLAHCDVKPQNVLIEVENGRPSCYLTDFGITQVLSETIIASRMFNVINLRGLSVYYASPEAFINFREKKFLSVDFKKYDIYSFACVLYELISQKAPWA
ncbi:hypothetical protein MP638_007547 [Amoeboaphelidium occidentale]|nr:hypothetical protein MP638_007547 [Amoeboaphelidium occidentale]